MKKEKHAFAVVLDEYGGMTGIITINDLVEQLVGELGDENKKEEVKQMELIGENIWKIHGSPDLEDLSEIVGVSLICEDYGDKNHQVEIAVVRVL